MQHYCLFKNDCWLHFSASEPILFFLVLHMFACFETVKKPNETAKKKQKPKMWKLSNEKKKTKTAKK